MCSGGRALRRRRSELGGDDRRRGEAREDAGVGCAVVERRGGSGFKYVHHGAGLPSWMIGGHDLRSSITRTWLAVKYNTNMACGRVKHEHGLRLSKTRIRDQERSSRGGGGSWGE
eukprot:3338671-Rhodomonas_salina.2